MENRFEEFLRGKFTKFDRYFDRVKIIIASVIILSIITSRYRSIYTNYTIFLRGKKTIQYFFLTVKKALFRVQDFVKSLFSIFDLSYILIEANYKITRDMHEKRFGNLYFSIPRKRGQSREGIKEKTKSVETRDLRTPPPLPSRVRSRVNPRLPRLIVCKPISEFTDFPPR